MRQWVLASTLVLVCVKFVAACGSSDSTNNGGTGGTANGTGGTTSTGAVSCEVEGWMGGDAPCQGSWTSCDDGKDYVITCTTETCDCKVSGSTTKTVPVASLCTATTTSDAVKPVVAACGFPL